MKLQGQAAALATLYTKLKNALSTNTLKKYQFKRHQAAYRALVSEQNINKWSDDLLRAATIAY